MKNTSPLRLLFLEDDADTRAMVTVALRQSDIEVHAVDTVDEALRLVDRQTYQAYLLDGMVPDGDSLRLCRALRARFPTRPVIFYSGLGFSTDIQKAMDAGASARSRAGVSNMRRVSLFRRLVPPYARGRHAFRQ